MAEHGGAFFARTAELNSLLARLENAPTAVLVMTGPPSCGKSVLLKQLVASVGSSPKPSVVDCRAGEYLSPVAFATNLLHCMKNDWQLRAEQLASAFVPYLSSLASSALGIPVTFDSLKAALEEEPAPLQMIMKAYLKLVQDARGLHAHGKPWPVIIIDEANALMEWENKSALTALLKFFVYLTKQEQLAHVILVTSDTFLTQWLDVGPIKAPFRSAFVLGNLALDEARTFFLDYALPLFPRAPPVQHDTWQHVYSVCGGNPGQLNVCIAEAAARSSWEEGCRVVVQSAMKDIVSGLTPETLAGAAWTAEDYRTVLTMIVSSPHHAVRVTELAAELGEAGFVKLVAMNQKNLLLLRAYDLLARDVAAEVFGPDEEEVYTLMSAAHVVAARRKLKL